MEKLVTVHKMRSEGGAIVEVAEFREIIPAATLSDPGACILGLKRLEASECGSAVNFVSDGKFQIVRSGEFLIADG